MPLHPTLRALLGATALCALPLVATAQTLPAPYVSRAVDAVLLPVDDNVVAAFGLGADEYGVLVLAVQPGGIAEAAGILPGDVIAMVQGETVLDPATVDAVVYYWLTQGMDEFTFDIWQAGAPAMASAIITEASFYEVIEITTVESWTSYSYESFSYEEFYAEYSVEITESYEMSETTIETMVTSEEFVSEMSSEETSDEVSETDMTEEQVDGTVDEGTDAAVDEYVEEPVEEDMGGGDEGGGDDGGDVVEE